MLLITWEELQQILTETVHTKKGFVARHTVSEAKLRSLEAPLSAMFEEFAINSNYRIAAFLANAIIESDHLKTFQEYASGAEYEGRADLGNTESGDGRRFKGRGIIQITGRNNYTACGKFFHRDLTSPAGTPELLASDVNLALRSGGWYWTTHVKPDLNTYADLGPNGFAETVHRVNGAVLAKRTHWPDRVKYYKRALGVLGAEVPDTVSSDHHAFHPKSSFHPKHRQRRHRVHRPNPATAAK